MAFEGGFRLFREVFLFETVKLLTIWYCFKEIVNKTENMIDKYPMGVYYMHVQDTLRGYIDRSSAIPCRYSIKDTLNRQGSQSCNAVGYITTRRI